ncbi:hypothetical protein V2A60_002221 [Cordyceps javanica]
MSITAEGQLHIGNANLYIKTWTPAGPVKAKLIFVHGFGEHINCYNDFFPRLAEQGIQVFGWDQRGWGRSVVMPSQRGQTGPTSLVISDIVAFIEDKLPSDAPIFVMGHSMGGGEVLTLVSDAANDKLIEQIRGWICESAFIGFSPEEEPSSVTMFLGRLFGRLVPNHQLTHVIPPERLSRDRAVVEALKDDPLRYQMGTLEGIASLLDRTAALASGTAPARKAVRSLFLAHGTQDKTCSFDAAMKYYEEQEVEDKSAKAYQGAYHSLHLDYCKDEFAADLVGWILFRSGVAVSSQPEPKL